MSIQAGIGFEQRMRYRKCLGKTPTNRLVLENFTGTVETAIYTQCSALLLPCSIQTCPRAKILSTALTVQHHGRSPNSDSEVNIDTVADSVCLPILFTLIHCYVSAPPPSRYSRVRGYFPGGVYLHCICKLVQFFSPAAMHHAIITAESYCALCADSKKDDFAHTKARANVRIIALVAV